MVLVGYDPARLARLPCRAAPPGPAAARSGCVGRPAEEEPVLNDILVELAIILALVLANGVFSGAEIAVISLRKTRLAQLVDEGRSSARAVKRLRDAPEQFLATVQIGITVVGATAAAFGGASLARHRAGARRDPRARPLRGAARARRSSSPRLVLSLVLGELVPKSIALRAPERYALLLAGPLLGLAQIARPLVWLLTAVLEPAPAPVRRSDHLHRGAPLGGGDRAARRRGGQGGARSTRPRPRSPRARSRSAISPRPT